MGRRSINTTKSGKYMNPTDQARKEARKKELKKNKKQRQMVRAAVLKGKDPAQLIEEMEKIDEMEYNVLQPSPLNEKVLREKRKKLKETFDRVMRLYHNDDPELWAELKRKEVEYERRRNKRVQYFESVRTAQTVQIEDIPLPDMCEKPATAPTSHPPPFGNVPLPPSFPPQIPSTGIPIPPSIQNAIAAHQKAVAEEKAASEPKKKEPPGCPPGCPPDLLTMRELDSDYESSDSDRGRKSPVPKRYKSSSRRYSSDRSSNRSDDRDSESDNEIDVPKPTSVQQRMLAIAGQKYDDFMKELENVHSQSNQSEDRQSSKQSERKRSAGDSESSGNESHSERNEPQPQQQSANEPNTNTQNTKPIDETNAAQAMRRENPAAIPNISAVPAPPIPPPMLQKMPRPPPPPMGMPPMMFRPPPMRPGLHALGMRMPSGGPNMMPRFRMPPGPPPGAPPNRLMHPHHNKFGPQHPQQQQQQPPNMMQQPPKDTKGMTTITAKPQIRNLSADVTRFVPSALRVKREDKKVQKPKSFVSEYRQQQNEAVSNKGTTKDDAYMQFMREMQGLL